MKGVLVSINPSLRLLDIGHDLPSQDVVHAGRVLERACPRFPKGSVHLAVIDPGVGSARAPIALLSGGHVFVAPDNGLLSAVVERLGGVDACFAIVEHPYIAAQMSSTFHGRDLFAPTAGALASGLVQLSELGPSWTPQLDTLPTACLNQAGEWLGEVQTIDHFGNAVTNIHAEVLKGGPFRVETDHLSLSISSTYADVAEGELVALIGSDGWLEIARRNGSASEYLGLDIGSSVKVRIDRLA